jgi:serine/threonine protein kinase/Tfp pilus assembly protein PilF
MPGTKKCSSCGAEISAASPSALCALCSLAGEVPANEGGQTKSILLSPFPLTEQPGDKIGRYKLLQVIGEGGFGVVYMAEQEEPVRRRVALKVIKLGMDTKQVIARFEAERQALALMDHPNIARVLDAGATERGRPYFVMELVKGERITEYCDKNNLTTRQRLDLFVQICHAIQHAHQKGIIHRDIKPSNILVTMHDGVPVPKVIDFGIAKATEQRLTEKTLFTELEQVIGTPVYMSPEQAEMTGIDIDTRSDIYSLGVLLYELLTGKTPFDSIELQKHGLEVMRRTIREQEPRRPSTRLTIMAEGELTTTAKHRQTDPPKLVHLVRGDLDWIVMKCLEKDRTRRYDTANDLASDLLRHVNNEPVLARPPSNAYRFQTMVRRNKLAFAAGTAVALAVLAGLVVSTFLLVRERRENARALAAEQHQRELSQQAVALQHEAEESAQAAFKEAFRSKYILNFFTSVLNGAGPAFARGRDTEVLRDILERTADRIPVDLRDQPDLEIDVRNTIGNLNRQMGEYALAEEMHRAALAVATRLGDKSGLLQAQAGRGLARALYSEGKYAEAEPYYRHALALQRDAPGSNDLAIAQTLNDLADCLNVELNRTEALQMYEESLAVRRRVLGETNLDVAMSMENIAVVLEQTGKLADAETMHRKVLALQRSIVKDDHPNVALTLNNLGAVLYREGKYSDAADIFREELEIRRKLFGDNHPDVAEALDNYGSTLIMTGDFPQAEKLLLEGWAITKPPRVVDSRIPKDILSGLVQLYQAWSTKDPTKASAVVTWKEEQKKFKQSLVKHETKSPSP